MDIRLFRSLALRPVVALVGLAALAFAPDSSAQIDTRNWFRLNFDVFGNSRSVDVLNDATDDKLTVAPSGSFTGQYWRFEQTDRVNYYRLSCRWQGIDRVLSAQANGLATLVARSSDPAQYWKIAANQYVSGAYVLSNYAAGGNFVLKARDVAPERYRLELVPLRNNPNRALRFTSLGLIDPASITQVGQGCATNTGTLLLGPVATNLPWIGETMIGQMRNVPTGSSSFLLVGLRRPLPLDLGFLGATGCTLYVDSVADFPLPIRMNISRWTLDIPNEDRLIGAQVLVQGVALFGSQVRTSNAAELTFGAR